MSLPPPTGSEASRGASRALAAAFLTALAGFAWLRFSYNFVDPDLWGHVLYGERAWLRGCIEKIDTLSWTASGHPWINHEILSEAVLAQAHRLGGGTGLWLLMLGMAVVTVGLALREGMRAGPPAQKWWALLLFGASINFIVTGYSVRPQLFTMLGLVLQIAIMRRLAARPAWMLALPVVFALWTNFHGGFLLGLALLVAAAFVQAMPGTRARRLAAIFPARQAPVTFFSATMLAAAAALFNPWGWHLVVWTAESVWLPRPNIAEWQPLGLKAMIELPGLALVFYLVLVGSVVAWSLSRAPRSAWEAAVLGVLALISIQHLRHTPLFGLANLMLTPPHLASAAARLAPRCRGLADLSRRPAIRRLLAAALFAAGVGAAIGSAFPRGRHLFTMAVERDSFPETAVAFIHDHGLYGRTIIYFDWGQYVLWELPENPVSFDGRLDTVYPGDVMAAHWRLYRGEPPGTGLKCADA
ncbi:MAG TPA: hypothetical protein VFB27_09860, partial [Opitutaceae bacterium]|nr:hypothetical protein [Opitutaceae bacterium]